MTRRDINGVDSYIAVVPDKDCVVNKGDHSPRGGTNALTVYTDREHPLTKPSERLLQPADPGGRRAASFADASWDEALDLIADKLKETLDTKAPSAIGVWGADHLSAEMNFPRPAVLRRAAAASTTRHSALTRASPCARSTTAPSGTPSIPRSGEHFGSNSTLLYSYSDFETADTVLLSGANSYETGTVLYNRIHAADNKKVVIDPRRTVPAANAEDGGGLHLQLKPGTDVVLVNSLMNVILAESLHDQAYIDTRVEQGQTFDELKRVVIAGQVPARRTPRW